MLKKLLLMSLRILLLMVPLFPSQWQFRIFSTTFSSISNKTRLNISFSHKHFSDFLKNRSNISFSVSPTDKTEIENIISSLDSNKSGGPNSIHTKVLKLLKNDISRQLSEIFNISFSSGNFPSILKTAKVTSVHKKDFKLDLSHYCPISLVSHFLCITEHRNSSLIIILFIPYNLALDKNIKQFMLSLALLNILEKN